MEVLLGLVQYLYVTDVSLLEQGGNIEGMAYDPNPEDDAFYEYETPIIMASSEGNIELVKALIEYGADIRAHDVNEEFGKTALIQACENGHFDIVEMLLDHGADIDDRCNAHETALMLSTDSREIVELLLNRGADVNAKSNQGWTTLWYACQYKQPEVVELLLARGADIESANDNGDTIFMIECWGGSHANIGMIEFLLKYNPNINARNFQGNTALMLAMEYKHIEVIKLLLKHGADTEIMDNGGNTALSIARQIRSVEIVKILSENAVA